MGANEKAMKHALQNQAAPWPFNFIRLIFYWSNHILENSVSPLSSLATAAW